MKEHQERKAGKQRPFFAEGHFFVVLLVSFLYILIEAKTDDDG